MNPGDGYSGQAYGAALPPPPASAPPPTPGAAAPPPAVTAPPQAHATAAATPLRRAGTQARGSVPGPTSGVPSGPPTGAAHRPAPPAPSAASDAADAGVRAIPRRGQVGPLSLTQIVVAEVAVLATIAAALQGPIPALVTGVAGLILIIVFFARQQGRWWLEHRQIARHHARRRAAAPETGAGPVLAALRTIAPGLAVRDMTAQDGARAGVAKDEAGWFSVVALTPAAPVHHDAAPIPLDALVSVLAATEQPGVVLELVTHTVPAPSPDVHASSPAVSSYRQLVESLSPEPVPAHRESTISVRVDARVLAEALHDHTADLETAAALVAGLGRKVATSLRRIGIACRVLDADELLAALARSCDVEAGSLAEGAQVDEDWTHWSSARLIHRTYWVKTWPTSAGEIGSLFAWAATAPAAQTSVALVLNAAADGEDVAVRAFIRLATRPDADLGALDRVLLEGVKRVGAELQPLDGEHGPAAYATAPTGGGAG
ncbi:Otogelin [Actinoplanes sp. SE50]|uniref:type VII secretion protein EccE n=1 Tax=unclassified Actinoplanes TaxID=2626549 RepID=UPI0009B0DDDD|nr:MULTISPECIES: type VII secretion protein EccE [unclassified Actinoplanes]ATO80897.1 Otogelin [Actinoplanes sp. SE50]SLL98304.1 Otogelin [Actinoplanes sp. SE50/110]